MRILNLYSGIGGNRLLWNNEHNITAVEIDEDIASIYSDLFPKDKIIITDAHKYLLENYFDYDFIWSSPPCQSHSQIRYNIGFLANRKYKKVSAIYPDMNLYQEIILLKKYFNGLWIVENTIAYYEPLIPAFKTAGHLWWSNFKIDALEHGNRNHRGGTVETLQERKQIDLSNYNIKNKRQILRNCVEPKTGRHVLNCMMNKYFNNTNLRQLLIW